MVLLSEQLVRLIERSADELTKRWLEDVRGRPETPTYHTFDPAELGHRVHLVYSQLGKWLCRTTAKEEIAKFFTDMGAQRHREGYALSEVIMALTIARRHIWLKVVSDGLLDTALELHRALELNNRVVLFFDRAIFFTAIGYAREQGAAS